MDSCFDSLTLGRQFEVAFENEMLPTDTYSVIEDDVRTILVSYPALAPFFRKMVDDYPGQADRQVFSMIEKVLDEQGH